MVISDKIWWLHSWNLENSGLYLKKNDCSWLEIHSWGSVINQEKGYNCHPNLNLDIRNSGGRGIQTNAVETQQWNCSFSLIPTSGQTTAPNECCYYSELKALACIPKLGNIVLSLMEKAHWCFEIGCHAQCFSLDLLLEIPKCGY